MGLTWKKNMETGIDWQDAQHKELFERINRLLEAMAQSKGKEEILNLVNFLDSYVVIHFSAEEKVMRSHHYREFSSHIEEHNKFKKDLAGIKQEIENGVKLVSIIKTQQKTVDWLIHHIGRSDKKLGDFIKSKMAA